MSTVLPQYPFDPTGVAPSNKVTETQSIRSRGMFDQYYIIPRSGPFYAESVRLRLYPQGANVNNPALGIPLEEGVHYNFGYHFIHASHTIGLPVYGAISFYDRQLEGQLRMEYQTIGDDWVLNDQMYSELLLNVLYNPRIGTWEQVVELPRMFPVVDHDFSIDDFVGMSDVVDELDNIEKALRQQSEGGVVDHVNDKDNPHQVGKFQVGLGLVDNYPTASIGEAQAGVANNRFMTPLRTKQLIDALSTPALNQHKLDLNNPHQTTKVHVGLGSVQNYAISTQAEAEAGASNARYMTPLRVREAIEALVGGRLSAHIVDYSNPHNTTKAQVGLGSVPNIPIASNNSALAGTADDGIITPRLLSLVLSQTIGSSITDHTGHLNNPHNTTKAHVGLGSVQNYGIASEAEARDATSNVKYMTPLAVRHAINELVGDSSNAHVTDYGNPHKTTKAQVGLGSVPNIPVASNASALAGATDDGIITPRLLSLVLSETVGSNVTNHINNSNNPHSTTKAQVGLGSVQNYGIASEPEARAATSNVKYMTPLAVRHAINELVGDSSNAHVTDYTNPHRVTAAQVGTYGEQEIDQLLADKLDFEDTAANAARVYGLSQPELQSWIGTISAGNSFKFDNKTYVEVKEDILTGKSADSAKLDGKTYEEIRNNITAAVDGSSFQYLVPPVPDVEDDMGMVLAAPQHWLLIGKYIQPVDYRYGDLTLLITGGHDEGSETDRHHTVILELSTTNDDDEENFPTFVPLLVRNPQVRHLTYSETPIEIGYVIHQQETDPYIDIYIKTIGLRTAWSITELTHRMFTPEELTTPTDVSELTLVEPAGIVYPTVILDGASDIAALKAFQARKDNPHAVTKAQVGLSAVANYGVASNPQAIAGTATNLYMTPASTAARVDDSIGKMCDELIVVIDDAIITLFA